MNNFISSNPSDPYFSLDPATFFLKKWKAKIWRKKWFKQTLTILIRSIFQAEIANCTHIGSDWSCQRIFHFHLTSARKCHKMNLLHLFLILFILTFSICYWRQSFIFYFPNRMLFFDVINLSLLQITVTSTFFMHNHNFLSFDTAKFRC